MDDEITAHVIDGTGVTPVRLVRDGSTYSNAETITVQPGAVIDLGEMPTGGSYALTFAAAPIAPPWFDFLP